MDNAAVGQDDYKAVSTDTRAAAILLLVVLAHGDKSLKGGRETDFGCWTGLLTERLAPMSQRNDELQAMRTAKYLLSC